MTQEKPYYYATSVENGVVVSHDGDEKYAVYESDILSARERSNLWHKWLENNVPNAHDNMGVVRDDVYAKYSDVRDDFMSGKRTA